MSEVVGPREVWEHFRPVSEAMQVFVAHGWNLDELEEFEDRWNTVTVPHLQKMNLGPKIQAELDRKIKFCHERIRKAEEEYEQGKKTFAERRYLIEKRIPVAVEFLEKYTRWQNFSPDIKWQPMDVVDIKQRGIDAFIRFNLDRFYG